MTMDELCCTARISQPVVELWAVEHLCPEDTSAQPIYHIGKATAHTDCNDIRQ